MGERVCLHWVSFYSIVTVYIAINCTIMIRSFKVGDAFVGYQEDTPAAVVFQVTHLLKDNESEDVKRWKMKVTFISNPISECQ